MSEDKISKGPEDKAPVEASDDSDPRGKAAKVAQRLLEEGKIAQDDA